MAITRDDKTGMLGLKVDKLVGRLMGGPTSYKSLAAAVRLSGKDAGVWFESGDADSDKVVEILKTFQAEDLEAWQYYLEKQEEEG